jgi:hypothetical protein
MNIRPRARTNCELTQGLFVPLLFGQDGCLAPQNDAGTSLSYFNLSQINVRTVFLPVAGSVEGSVVSVKKLPSNL